jgi:beta-1,4-mannosyl-glycoprotein beta-1,4-N-acetylglucosaminyltransferase
MKVFNKIHKKIDCILFYDELEMLLFRLNELEDQVDYFIIMECDVDFRGKNKKLFFQENKDLFKKWESKIIYLPTTNITKNHIDSICEITKFTGLTQFKNTELTSNEIIYCQLYDLYNFLISFNLYSEEIILFSNVDEIPDLNHFDSVIENLNFEPVFLKQTNFIWTTKYYDPTPYLGTACFQFASLLGFPNKIFQKYLSKKNRLFNTETICENGFYFSHFYSLEKTIEKLKLISDDKNITERITNGFNNLISIHDYGYENLQPLIQYSGKLPKRHDLLPCQNIGRSYSKKYTVLLNSEIESSDYIIPITFTTDLYHTKTKNNFKILIPSSQYYDIVIKENTLENFQKMYGANEIKKILKSFYPLNQDSFEFISGEKSVEYSWLELKDEFIYDKIKEIL